MIVNIAKRKAYSTRRDNNRLICLCGKINSDLSPHFKCAGNKREQIRRIIGKHHPALRAQAGGMRRHAVKSGARVIDDRGIVPKTLKFAA